MSADAVVLFLPPLVFGVLVLPVVVLLAVVLLAADAVDVALGFLSTCF